MHTSGVRAAKKYSIELHKQSFVKCRAHSKMFGTVVKNEFQTLTCRFPLTDKLFLASRSCCVLCEGVPTLGWQ